MPEAPETSDPDLVAAMARGDGQALGVLYDRHAPTLLAAAGRILGSQREAEDLVHDVLMEAWQKAGDYDRARAGVYAHGCWYDCAVVPSIAGAAPAVSGF